MYDDIDYKFNWVGLIIKIVIFIILILLAIWVVSSTFTKKEKQNNFNDNFNFFNETALNYFEGENLPKEENEKITLTLNAMIKKGIINELVDQDGNVCDKNNSYIEAIKIDDYYEITVKLICGSDEKVIKNKINGEQCKTEDCVMDTDDSNTENEENSNNDTDGSDKLTYYEYVKVYKNYTPWQLKKITGDNVETKKDNMSISTFCKVNDVKYYSTGYITLDMNNYYSYKVRLTDIPSNASNVKILGKGYFDNDLSYYQERINGTNLSMIGGGVSKYGVDLPDVYTYRDTSLKSNNFTFSVSNPKKEKGYYYVEIKVNINNRNNVSKYYASNLKQYVYFVPLYFYGEYVDTNNCVEDTNENATSYISYKILNTHKENVTVYRSYTLEKDYSDIKWSTETSLDGYVKTGNTELR